MSKKIVYLLGAGASANALPVVSHLKDRFKSFCDHFERYITETYRTETGGQIKLVQTYNELLVSNLQTHHTIDTYARKLYLQSLLTNDKTTYELLKKYLSAFFSYEQITIDFKENCNKYIDEVINAAVEKTSSKLQLINSVIQNFDYRYDSFFASVLKVNKSIEIQLPDEISIVSWNYDYQIEKAFINFSSRNLDEVQNMLKVFGSFNRQIISKNEIYSLIKLNGTAGFIDIETGENIIDFKSDTLTKKIFEFFDQALLSKTNNFHNGVRFAWEDEKISDEAISIANTKMKEADIIVIVGYSFPYFNREVDRKIFEGLENIGPNKKIYLQAPADTIDSTANRFKAVFSKYALEKHIEIDQFLIPNEF